MSIQPGQSLLHYRLIEKIGEGGMGVVWKAVDTTLDREVAIKVLPETFSVNIDRLARFEREAKVLASLNHPNIASIHGLHEVDQLHFLAMELVSGESLDQRLARGPVSCEESVGFAVQIAEALEAAHENGVIHRDLKPANIQVTPDGKIKVLDFGLAKAVATETSSSGPSLSPTVTSGGTVAGAILGTAAYMSPEQARGKAVDKRADIWAFGCVLFECLSGKRAFEGETISDILASVLRAEPDWTALPKGLPQRLTELLRRCLVKNPVDRLRDMGEARIALDQLDSPQATGVVGETQPKRGWMAWLLPLAVAVTVLVTATVVINLRPTEQPPLLKFRLLGPEHRVDPLEVPSISPDGTEVVYYAEGQLWIRSLDRLDPRPIPNSNGARNPFWSPDGEWVAFYSSSKLWKVLASGGEPTMITAVPDKGLLGGAWFRDGSIYISTGFSGLLRVSDKGGELVEVLPIGSGESDFHAVSGLPQGAGVLFIVHRQVGIDTVALWDGEERKQILQLEGMYLTAATYSSSGHILFARMGSNPGIWAVPFSLQDLETTGEPFLAVADAASPSVSRDGTLLYLPGGASQRRQMVWVDREGNALGDVWEPRDGLENPEISPDGRRVAVSIDEGGEQNIWVYDLVAEVGHRLTFNVGAASSPTWTPDGLRIAFDCTQDGSRSICMKAADGTGDTHTLVSQGFYSDVSADGKTLVYYVGGEGTRFDIWYRGMEETATPTSFLRGPDSEVWPRISPDGRHLAYVSWAEGRDVFLIRFPQGEGNRHVAAGDLPRWSSTGDELFYVYENRDFMVVSVETEPSLTLGAATKLFSDPERYGYDVAPDGQRFLLVHDVGELENPNLAVVQNWFAEFSANR